MGIFLLATARMLSASARLDRLLGSAAAWYCTRTRTRTAACSDTTDARLTKPLGLTTTARAAARVTSVRYSYGTRTVVEQ